MTKCTNCGYEDDLIAGLCPNCHRAYMSGIDYAINYLMDRNVIRYGMFSPQLLVAYTDTDPIDIPADLGAAEKGENI